MPELFSGLYKHRELITLLTRQLPGTHHAIRSYHYWQRLRRRRRWLLCAPCRTQCSDDRCPSTSPPRKAAITAAAVLSVTPMAKVRNMFRWCCVPSSYGMNWQRSVAKPCLNAPASLTSAPPAPLFSPTSPPAPVRSSLRWKSWMPRP